jgi:hypothetical protein
MDPEGNKIELWEPRKRVRNMRRKSAREKKTGKESERKEAMHAVVGLWKDRTDLPNTETYLRHLRKDGRLRRVFK